MSDPSDGGAVFLIVVLVSFFILLVSIFSHRCGEKEVRKEAIAIGLAEWVQPDKNLPTMEFQWKTNR